MGTVMDPKEIKKLEAFFRRQFKNPAIVVKAHPRKKDMSEVYIGEDFLGPIYRETDDGETSWNFQMAILEIDLED